jgi:TRAP-type C4-dicarboxylate transport system permease small subunit
MARPAVDSGLSAMDRLTRLFDRLIDALALTACVLICLLTFGVALDVILRALSLGSIAWATDMSEYLLYAVTFLGAPWVLRANGHVNVDIVVRHLRPAAARLFALVADVAGLGVSLVLLYYGVKIGLDSYNSGSMVFKFLVFPEWYVMWPIPVGAFLLACEFVRRIARQARGS